MSPLMSVVVLLDTIKCNYAVQYAQSQTDIYCICKEFECGRQKRAALDAYLHCVKKKAEQSFVFLCINGNKYLKKLLLLV